MIRLAPRNAAEVLAIVLCPARVFGAEADTAVALKKVKEAIIRRFRISVRC